MSLNNQRLAAIDIAIAAGTEPTLGRFAQTTLRLRQNAGRSSYNVLSRTDGSLTPAGDHYYATTGLAPPSTQFDRGTPLVKKGAGDYVQTRNGKLTLVRKPLPDGSTHVTRLRKPYFRGGEDGVKRENGIPRERKCEREKEGGGRRRVTNKYRVQAKRGNYISYFNTTLFRDFCCQVIAVQLHVLIHRIYRRTTA